MVVGFRYILETDDLLDDEPTQHGFLEFRNFEVRMVQNNIYSQPKSHLFVIIKLQGPGISTKLVLLSVWMFLVRWIDLFTLYTKLEYVFCHSCQAEKIILEA